MRIGLVSDTHGFFDERLASVLAGVEVILHAGDAGSEDVLEQLSALAPTRAVRGNVDALAMGLPLSFTVAIAAIQFEMVHILPASQDQLKSWNRDGPLTGGEVRGVRRFLASFQSETRVVVFGHTHQPYVNLLGPLLLINPGSAGKKRFNLPRCCGVLAVSRKRLEVKIISLEDYNEIMRGSFRLTPGGFAACSP